MSARTTTQAFFDPQTWTVTYVVWDPSTRRAAVIDPVLDYTPYPHVLNVLNVLTCARRAPGMECKGKGASALPNATNSKEISAKPQDGGLDGAGDQSRVSRREVRCRWTRLTAFGTQV